MRDLAYWALRLVVFLAVVALTFHTLARVVGDWPVEVAAEPCR